jgi:hypothetical protein
MAAAKTLRAVTSFVATVKDTEHFIREGEVVASTDPVVKGREELFETHDPNQPTAAIG